jgi:hypothetical protein
VLAGGSTLAGKLGVGATKIGFSLSRKVLTAALSTTAVAGGTAAVVVYQADPPPSSAAAVVSTQAPTPRLTLPPSPVPSSVPPVPSKSPAKKPATKPPVVIKASAKKGVGVWEFAGTKSALADVGAGWYYNWSSNNDAMPAPAGVDFVPMIWGKADVTAAKLKQVKAEGDELLGFNEPDLDGQAKMSVEDALAAWPKLEGTGLRLGSPAVAFGGDTAGGWLDRFMTGAKQKGYRVDFITLHWYGSDFSSAAAGQFLGYVDAVHQRYGKPIWVTEYGLMNFSGSPKYPTGAQAATFIKATTKGMASRRFVERYAWFGLPAVGDSADFGLYRDGKTPTEAGKAYRAAG